MEKRVVLITGGASGLGLSTAIMAAKQGDTVVIVDINEEPLQKAKAEIEAVAPNGSVLAIVADVSKEDQVEAYVKETLDAYGRIDCFFNNAGIEGVQDPMTVYPVNTFKKVIDINLTGVFYGLKHVLPVMVAQKSGSVVNTASVGGLLGVINQSPYVASKHAVIGLTKSAVADYAVHGVRINAIAPGAIKTPMVAEAFRMLNPDDPEAAEKAFTLDNPTKRLGMPDEVAPVVLFLFSDAAGYVNGQVIAIDGGQSVMY